MQGFCETLTIYLNKIYYIGMRDKTHVSFCHENRTTLQVAWVGLLAYKSEVPDKTIKSKFSS